MALKEYEIRHSDYLRKNGAECAVLLKTDGRFPLLSPGTIAAYGSGVRHTVKGGTGSGEVNSRRFNSIELALKYAGFKVTSGDWLDRYDRIRGEAYEQFLRDIRKEARQKHTLAIMLAMGRSMPEPEYELSLDGEGDTAIYVVSRISGEGSDRMQESGELALSKTEIRDILVCSQKYRNFMLVLNTGGPVDLTPVMEVGNILVLSQLGAMTGEILADMILGTQTPSGHLTTTWAALDQYPDAGTFEEINDTRYKEGIYVGYRYFDAVGRKPLFPFGYGCSYTTFFMKLLKAQLDGERMCIQAQVRNTGRFSGKEVLFLYVHKPEGKLDQPPRVLAAFSKTRLLEPLEEETLSLEFPVAGLASYDSETAEWVLETGTYTVYLVNGTGERITAAFLDAADRMVVRKCRNVMGKPDFEDLRPQRREENILSGSLPDTSPTFVISADSVAGQGRDPEKENVLSGEEDPQRPIVERGLPERLVSGGRNAAVPDEKPHGHIDPLVSELSDEELCYIALGAFDPKGGIAGMVGDSGMSVAGAAGETTDALSDKGVRTLVMADGPAGLRLSREYVVDEQGVHALGSSMIESMMDLLPGPVRAYMRFREKRPDPGQEVFEQYACAIPVGTALAQSFNTDFAEACGDMVGDEMERFGVHLWLAPALNIHRDIRCGRNFEYFSEDPLVSGKFAAAITRGVQKHKGCGTVLKHFAANNQELNRMYSNSMVSERALREIYLKGFEIAVRESHPHAVMTSYNLINGTHTSESRELTEEILRGEFGHSGIVMTDWVVSAMKPLAGSVHRNASPEKVAAAGGDLFMPGSRKDYDKLLEAVRTETVSRDQLRINATRVLELIRLLNPASEEENAGT